MNTDQAYICDNFYQTVPKTNISIRQQKYDTYEVQGESRSNMYQSDDSKSDFLSKTYYTCANKKRTNYSKSHSATILPHRKLVKIMF